MRHLSIINYSHLLGHYMLSLEVSFQKTFNSMAWKMLAYNITLEKAQYKLYFAIKSCLSYKPMHNTWLEIY